MLPRERCTCEQFPPGEACPHCWELHLTDLDDHDGWPDEVPQLPESAYYDAADLAELFEPSEGDEAARLAWQTKGSK